MSPGKAHIIQLLIIQLDGKNAIIEADFEVYHSELSSSESNLVSAKFCYFCPAEKHLTLLLFKGAA